MTEMELLDPEFSFVLSLISVVIYSSPLQHAPNESSVSHPKKPSPKTQTAEEMVSNPSFGMW